MQCCVKVPVCRGKVNPFDLEVVAVPDPVVFEQGVQQECPPPVNLVFFTLNLGCSLRGSADHWRDVVLKVLEYAILVTDAGYLAAFRTAIDHIEHQ